jgi:hypothetical protein
MPGFSQKYLRTLTNMTREIQSHLEEPTPGRWHVVIPEFGETVEVDHGMRLSDLRDRIRAAVDPHLEPGESYVVATAMRVQGARDSE